MKKIKNNAKGTYVIALKPIGSMKYSSSKE